MVFDQSLQNGPVLWFQRHDFDHLRIVELGELAGFIQNVGDAATHPRSEIPAGRAEHHYRSIGHVFAAVVADAFDDGGAARVPHTETLAGTAAGVKVTAGGAIHHRVAQDGVFRGREFHASPRFDDDFACGHAFTDIVIGLTRQDQLDAAAEERAEGLAGAAFQLDGDGAFRHAGVAPVISDLPTELGADVAVGILDLEGKFDRHLIGDGVLGLLDDFVIQRMRMTAVIAPFQTNPGHILPQFCGHIFEHPAQADGVGLRMIFDMALFDEFDPADEVIQLPHAEGGHDFAYFMGD